MSREISILYEKSYKEKKSNNIAQAFRKEKSFITNAFIHRNRKYIINLDLKDFFNTFHFGRVKGFFSKDKLFMLNDTMSIILAQLTCYNGVLPQGAPTSPVITNYIFRIVDRRILELAKKYRLNYSRYADDLTFSTNDHKIKDTYNEFINELRELIKKSGFEINDKKTNFQYFFSRQLVTGLVVNKKVNCKREYYKLTKSMALSLYKTGRFTINGVEGKINQLEGRFSFANQMDKENNQLEGKNMKNDKLNIREKEYKKFLFYKIFIKNNFPLIVTEGKTDVKYIKAALMNLYNDYPDLVMKENNEFNFNLSFFKRTKRIAYLLKIALDGADTLANIYKVYNSNNSLYNYFRLKFNTISNKPVILLYDNEDNKEKPLQKFLKDVKTDEVRKNVKLNFYSKLVKNTNLYLLTIPKKETDIDIEIEHLFDEKTRGKIIEGKKLSLASKLDSNTEYGKEVFSKYVLSNYENIDFSNFKPLLNKILEIKKDYEINEK